MLARLAVVMQVSTPVCAHGSLTRAPHLIRSDNKSLGPFLLTTEHILLSGIMPTRMTGRCMPLFLDLCWSFYHRIPRMGLNNIYMEFVFMSTMRWLNRTKRMPCASFPRCDGVSERDESIL